MRESGILLPVSSLPSKYGIGCFSKEAYEFIDFLKASGQKDWQILPLGPTGYGDSPYQAFSTFAGNPYYIDLEMLIQQGLLTEDECEQADFGSCEAYVDYEKMYFARFALLRKAFVRFDQNTEDYIEFVRREDYWLEDYCLYMAVKDSLGGVAWTEWEPALRDRHEVALEAARRVLSEEIAFYRFQQYMFYKQWNGIHDYAKENGVKIIGDIPIYVAFDSADTWSNPELFQFTEANLPKAVAGCPPDGFSATGQLWGNPLYDWEYHKKTGYAWWQKRIAHCFKMYDVVRVDHFRGFDEYYSIPYGDETAQFGHWEKGPGLELFETLKNNLGDLNIIAEDLGFLTESVLKMVKDTGYPGMKVLQFAFDSSEKSDYLPHNYNRNCVVYTGTHDNDTVMGWYDSMNEHDRDFAFRYMNNFRTPREEIAWDFIRLAQASVADLCIIPIQDYLSLGKEARINTPSTLGDNWKWRLKKGQITDTLIENIRRITRLYGRI